MVAISPYAASPSATPAARCTVVMVTSARSHTWSQALYHGLNILNQDNTVTRRYKLSHDTRYSAVPGGRGCTRPRPRPPRRRGRSGGWWRSRCTDSPAQWRTWDPGLFGAITSNIEVVFNKTFEVSGLWTAQVTHDHDVTMTKLLAW